MGAEISTSLKIVTFNGESLIEQDDLIAIESALTIILDGAEFATIVCSTVQLPELVIGFLASEGIIRTYEEIKAMNVDENKGFAYVDLVNPSGIQKDYHSKRFIGSCCGKGRQFYFHNDVKTAKTIRTKMTISPNQCLDLMKKLQQDSIHFHQTGGVHHAALCTVGGLVVSRIDIGRHNALDRIFGYCLMNRVSLRDKVIVFSGRISSEVLLKAAKIGVGIILSKSAPTNLSINLAKELGITAVGFVRENRFNVYSHAERIRLESV